MSSAVRLLVDTQKATVELILTDYPLVESVTDLAMFHPAEGETIDLPSVLRCNNWVHGLFYGNGVFLLEQFPLATLHSILLSFITAEIDVGELHQVRRTERASEEISSGELIKRRYVCLASRIAVLGGNDDTKLLFEGYPSEM